MATGRLRRGDTFLASLTLLLICAAIGLASAQQELPDAPSATKQKEVLAVPSATKTNAERRAPPAERSWPRTFTVGNDRFTIYQPQAEKWDGNLIDLYSAVEAKKLNASPANYGVVWLQARTEVDKVNRLVTLDQVKITKVKFPAATDRETVLTDLLQKKLPGATKTVSLDRLQAAVDLDSEVIKPVEVKNDPPKVIITSKPSMLVLIDGPAQMRELPDTKLQ